jgi:HK97 family phage major capsid protein
VNRLNKQEYLDRRNALLAEAEAAVNEAENAGDDEELMAQKLAVYEAKTAEIEALDAEYEKAAKAAANARAAKGKLADLTAMGQKEVVDKMGDNIKDNAVQAAAERGRALKDHQEVRVASLGFLVPDTRFFNATKLTSDGIVVPTRTSPELGQTFNEVSSLIDRVQVIPRLGGESFVKSFVAGYGEGAEVDDDADYEEVDTVFGKAAINKAKITAYSEEDEGVLKLPDVDYDSEVQKGIRVALRKRITRQIINGTGATNKLAGIFSAAATAIDPTTDVLVSEIDEDTLDEIIFSYGGDEDVEDAAVLILNKNDLKELVQLRSDGGNRIHKVVARGNVGTIDGIPYIINSACGAISAAATVDGTYCMAYGSLSGYGLAIFSDIDIQRSTDYKFRSGQIAHRGSIYVGGNVIRKNGFVRVKKG